MHYFIRTLVLSLSLAPTAFAAPHVAAKPAAKQEAPAAYIHTDAQFADIKGEARSKTIHAIEQYLSGITTLTAQFTQVSSDGSTGSGVFYMKRPGKVRWQYSPPNELLLVSNGKTLTYYDPGLKQVTYMSIDGTLASFIAQKTIVLDGPVTQLTQLTSDSAGTIRATLLQRKKPDEGSLTLEFSGKPLALKRLITVDATGNETQVTLLKPQLGTTLEDKLFLFTDPRSINDRRNRKN